MYKKESSSRCYISDQNRFLHSNKFYTENDRKKHIRDLTDLLNDSAQKLQDNKKSMREKLLIVTMITAIHRNINVVNNDDKCSPVEDMSSGQDVIPMEVDEDSQNATSNPVLDVHMEDLTITNFHDINFDLNDHHISSSYAPHIFSTTITPFSYNTFGVSKHI